MINKKFLILTHWDDANGGYDILQSLRANGCDAEGYKLAAHKFQYANQLALSAFEQIRDKVSMCDVVIFSQVNFQLMEFCKPMLIGKLVVTVHGGSDYRKAKDYWNEYCNQFTSFTILSADNWNDGANNPFMWMCIDTERYKPNVMPYNGKLRVYHSPSNPEKKGTKLIEVVLSQIDNIDYTIQKTRLTHTQNISMMRGCDVYIDQIGLGNWGTAAREAAALGCIVVSNDQHTDLYKSQFGDITGIITANDDECLLFVLSLLADSSVGYINDAKASTRKWIETHSYLNAGKRLLGKIGL